MNKSVTLIPLLLIISYWQTQGTQDAAFWEFSFLDNCMERGINSSYIIKGVLHRHQALKQAGGWYDTLL